MLKVACFIESQQNRGNIPQYQRIIVSLCDGGEANPTEKKKTEREREIVPYCPSLILSCYHTFMFSNLITAHTKTKSNKEQQHFHSCKKGLKNGMKLEKRNVPWKNLRGLDKFAALGKKIKRPGAVEMVGVVVMEIRKICKHKAPIFFSRVNFFFLEPSNVLASL